MTDLLTDYQLLFLAPLLGGFAFNSTSAFTCALSRRWGETVGRAATAVLRNVLGIPVWVSGLVLAARTPALGLLPEGGVAEAGGWLLVGLGTALVIWSLAALRWRAAAPSTGDCLVEAGPYAHVRHPLYDGVMAQLLGLCLLMPRWPVLLACGLVAAWIQVQARLEERDLLERAPGYRQYMTRVPRFVPGAPHPPPLS